MFPVFPLRRRSSRTLPERIQLGWPNRITIARILLIAPFVLCLLNLGVQGYGWLRWVAVSVFALMAISDGLDGFLARRLRAETDLGRFLDPLADKLLITFAVISLAVVGVPGPDGPDAAGAPAMVTLPNWVAVSAIAKDLLICIGFAVVRLQTGRVHIHPRWAGKACTTVQLLMVLAMLLWLDLPAAARWLPRALWYLATAMAVVATFDYLRIGSRVLSSGQGSHRENTDA